MAAAAVHVDVDEAGCDVRTALFLAGDVDLRDHPVPHEEAPGGDVILEDEAACDDDLAGGAGPGSVGRAGSLPTAHRAPRGRERGADPRAGIHATSAGRPAEGRSLARRLDLEVHVERMSVGGVARLRRLERSSAQVDDDAPLHEQG